MRVTVNPGHCPGIDPGAMGPAGLREADVALAVGKLTAEYLRAAGCEVLLIQDDSLEKICSESNAFRADLFVSIHCNSHTSPAAHGCEFWTARNASMGAYRLASCLEKQFCATFPKLYNRGVKTGGLYVTLHTDCPACLVETAFISNPAEERLLADPVWQDECAKAIARGVTDAMQ